jgi:hypothetical protein
MTGLLLALADAPDGREEAFNTWYGHHAAARLTVPGILSAERYVALAGRPKYLATYDLSSVRVMESTAYRALRSNRPDGEQEMLDSLPVPIDRRIYRRLSNQSVDNFTLEDVTYTVASWSLGGDTGGVETSERCIRWRRFQLVEGKGAEHLTLCDFDSPIPDKGTPGQIVQAQEGERRVFALTSRF